MSRPSYLEGLAITGIATHNVAYLRRALNSGLSKLHTFNAGPPTFNTLSLLEYCVYKNFSEGAKTILRGPYVETKLALEAACIQGNEVIVDILLKNATYRRRRCCECLFTLFDNHMTTVANTFLNCPRYDIHDQDLIVSAAYINAARGRAGQSALHVGTIFGFPVTVEQCLSRGIYVDITDAEGNSSLSLACAKGYFFCAKTLLQHGANPTYTQHERFRRQVPRSPLFSLCHSSSLISSDDNEEMVDMLWFAGLDITKEHWLNSPSPQHLNKYVGDDLYQYLKTAQKSPTSLLHLCLCSIRFYIHRASNGINMKDRYEKLALLFPETVKQHFNLGYFTSLTPNHQ